MKIAFIVDIFPCLSQTFILHQMTGLIDRGHEVRIFALNVSRETKAHPTITQYRLLEKVVTLETESSRYRRLGKAMGRLVLLFGRRPGPAFKVFKIFRKYSPMTLLGFLRFIHPFLREHFDIVHAHFGSNGNLALALKEFNPTLKIVTSFHGHDLHSYIRARGPAVYERLFRRGDCFTANTQFTADRMISLGCPATLLRILPVGLYLDQFLYQARSRPADGTIRVLTVARLVEKKGHAHFLKALEKVVKTHPNLHYTIAGEGPLKETLHHLVKELGLNSAVEFTGAQTIEEVRALYRKAHIFVLPSVTASDGDMEGQGLVLQEAQACGLPVLSTRHNGIPEGVWAEHSGFLVPEREVSALAEKLTYLIEHADEWPRMGRNGRRFVEKKYDQQKLNRQLEGLYRELLNLKE